MACAFVGQGDVDAFDAAPLQERREGSGEFERGLPRALVLDPDVVPADREADDDAERLRKRLLGGKALGEIGRPLALAAEALELRRHQYSFGEALAEALQCTLDAADVAQIGPDSEDHDVPLPGSATPRRIAPRYLRTASARPSSRASEINACPIDTSSTFGTERRKRGKLPRLRSWPALTPRPERCAARAASASRPSTVSSSAVPNASAYASVYSSIRSAPRP